MLAGFGLIILCIAVGVGLGVGWAKLTSSHDEGYVSPGQLLISADQRTLASTVEAQ
jgi:hypothetical protein